MLRIGTDAPDFSFCYLARELGEAPDASRAAVPKKNRDAGRGTVPALGTILINQFKSEASA